MPVTTLRFILSVGLISCLADSVAGTTCLQNAVTTRKDLVNAKGESYPVGLASGNWPSAQVLAEIAKIAIEEILGYNTQLTGYSSSPVAWRALFGCTNPTDMSDNSGCSDGNTYSHVMMESWGFSYQSTWQELVNANSSFAAFRGSNLFNGLVGMYIGKAVWEQKTSAPLLDTKEGLHEDGQPWTYFDAISAFNTDYLKPCTSTLLMNDDIMRSYLTITGDTAGVSLTSNGLYVGVCHADYWWLAPGECRTSSGLRCVPVITGGTGWALEEYMQKATVWQIPLAIGVAYDWKRFTELPMSKKCLFYWWEPDPTFATLEPKSVTFPAHNAEAWATGNKTTTDGTGMLENLVSYDLPDLAQDVYGFVYHFQMSMDTMRGIMRDVASGESSKDAACGWAMLNTDVLRSFIPTMTSTMTNTTTVPTMTTTVTVTSSVTMTETSTEAVDETGETSTTAGSTSAGSTSGGSADTTTTEDSGSNVVEVTLTLTVDDPAVITENATLTNAMIQGFADVMGVEASQVTLEFEVARRLGDRRLQVQLQAIFSVTFPDAAAAEESRDAIQAVSVADTNQAISDSVVGAGYGGTIEVTGKEAIIAVALEGPTGGAMPALTVGVLTQLAIALLQA